MSLSWAFVDKCSVNSDVILNTLINSTLSSTSDWNYAVNYIFFHYVNVLSILIGDNMAAPVASPCAASIALQLHKLSGIYFHCSVSTTWCQGVCAEWRPHEGFIFTQLKWAHCVCVFQYIALKKCGSLPSWQRWGCHGWSACACEDIVRELFSRNGLAEKSISFN